MLDILNPCNNPNAMWQQLLMLGLPLLLGFLFGRGGSKPAEVDPAAKARLQKLEADLADCRSNTNTANSKLNEAEKAAASIQTGSVNLKANSLTAGASAGVAAAAVTTAATGVAAAASNKKDDLKVVEGIGPKIESLFNEAGIYSFEQLATTAPERLKEILEAAGSRFQMHDPSTWPAQSKLAADGKWEELKRWQDELNKGQAE
jgi:predicted flap endonuclease-1-like 5' DNA nuclease